MKFTLFLLKNILWHFLFPSAVIYYLIHGDMGIMKMYFSWKPKY